MLYDKNIHCLVVNRSINISNYSEEREEKKDSKTCEEEVQRLSDGSEIRTRKTRTFNMQQNSKQVTNPFFFF